MKNKICICDNCGKEIYSNCRDLLIPRYGVNFSDKADYKIRVCNDCWEKIKREYSLYIQNYKKRRTRFIRGINKLADDFIKEVKVNNNDKKA